MSSHPMMPGKILKHGRRPFAARLAAAPRTRPISAASGLSTAELAGYRRFVRQYLAGMIGSGQIPGLRPAVATNAGAVLTRVNPRRRLRERTMVDRILAGRRPRQPVWPERPDRRSRAQRDRSGSARHALPDSAVRSVSQFSEAFGPTVALARRRLPLVARNPRPLGDVPRRPSSRVIHAAHLLDRSRNSTSSRHRWHPVRADETKWFSFGGRGLVTNQRLLEMGINAAELGRSKPQNGVLSEAGSAFMEKIRAAIVAEFVELLEESK